MLFKTTCWRKTGICSWQLAIIRRRYVCTAAHAPQHVCFMFSSLLFDIQSKCHWYMQRQSAMWPQITWPATKTQQKSILFARFWRTGSPLYTRYAVNGPAVRPHGLILSQDGATARMHLLDAFPCRLDRFSVEFCTKKLDVLISYILPYILCKNSKILRGWSTYSI